MDPLPITADGNLVFACPRCKRPVEERFYGACDACRTELASTMRLQPREIDVEAYTPKVNVVANQVAMKADAD